MMANMYMTMSSSRTADATHSVIVLKKAIMRICRPRTWFKMRKTQTILSVRRMRSRWTVEVATSSTTARIVVIQRMTKSNMFQPTRQ